MPHLPSTSMNFEEFLEDIVIRKALLSMRKCLPAVVLEYVPPEEGARPTPPRARVRIDLAYARDGFADEVNAPPHPAAEVFEDSVDPAQGGEIVGRYPELLVPVHFPGPWHMWTRGPLAKGEQGKLVWCDRSIDGWQVDGGQQGLKAAPVDPVFQHLHGGGLAGISHDAWFEPGIRSGKALAGGSGASQVGPSVIPADGHAIGHADGSAGLEIKTETSATPRQVELRTTGSRVILDATGPTPTVEVGQPVAGKIAIAEIIVEIFESIVFTFGWIPVPNDGGAALKAQSLLPLGLVTKINALKNLIASEKGRA